MLLYNLKLVFRNLLKNKLYSFLSITGFAFGFAVCIVIALYAHNEYTVDHCYPNYERVFRLVNEKKKTCLIDCNLNKMLSDNNPEILFACPLEIEPDYKFSVKSKNRYAKTIGAITTDNDFFKFFSIRVICAISNKPFSDKETVIITESLAKKLFEQDEDPLGKSINIFNEFEATISAVIEDFPANSSIKGTVLLNFENEKFRFNRFCHNHKCINPVNHFLLLDKNVNSDDLTEKLNRNISAYKFAIDSIGLQKLSDIYFDNTIIDNANLQGNRNLIIVFIAIGALIMLLSVINYLNYNLSLQYAKIWEIWIKRINGAGFKHIIGYYFTDVSVGILISIDIALIFVGIFISNIDGLLNKHLNLNVLLTPRMLFFSVGVVILIIIVNSIALLYIFSRFSHSTFSLKKASGGKLVGRSILTTFQFTIAIALITCVIIIQKQLVYAQDADLGFNKEHLLKFSLPTDFLKQQVIKQELEKLPFVVGATLSGGTPGEIYTRMGSGDTTKERFSLACIFADTSFLKIMDIELLDGCSFLKGGMGKTCIMNQEAIKRYGWKTIDNKKFKNKRDGGYQVVGVVKNFHIGSFHQSIEPVCIISCSADSYNEMHNLSLRITPGEIKSKLEQIETIWKKIIPDDPMDFTFYDSVFEAFYRKEKILATIIMFFSLIAIVLNFMGILGQVFQTCINRTKEIGIRKVNGASTWTIIRMLNFDFVKLIFIAFAIATPLAYYIMDKWLQNFAYKTIMSCDFYYFSYYSDLA